MLKLSVLPIVATIGDPDGTRTITAIIALLVAIGLALVLLAVWLFKSTRPDRDLLAPLEVMGERSWRRKDPVWQRRRLDEVRPVGAHPLVSIAAPPELDESFEAGPSATGFDDLRDGDPPPASSDRTATDASAVDEPPAAGRGTFDTTPVGTDGLDLSDLPDDEFDEEALAAAREDLERELTEASRRSASEQLGLFDGDQQP